MYKLTNCRRRSPGLFMAVLLACLLFSVQMAAASLHTHTEQHTSCALCHVQYHDLATADLQAALVLSPAGFSLLPAATCFIPASRPAPYQSRAPPAA